MTTYLPYRANVFCSLGHLIDGQFADTYLQQAGLIFCRGSVRLAGIFRPSIGAVVDFAYTRDNVTAARIPRRLRVLSSFADPFTNITTVQLGCKLSLLQDNREPEATATPLDTNPSLPAGWEDYFAPPITAISVANKCLARLGITAAASLPLSNRFTRDAIDLSSGYVEVLGKLLESETYVGWLNEEEELEIRSLIGPDIALGPVLNNTNVFTLSPIGVGSLPGEAVTVSYSPLRLKDFSITIGVSSTLGSASGWNGSVTYGFPVNYSIAYNSGGPQTFTGTYIPVQQTSSTFSGGVMVRSITSTGKPYAAVAGKYASQALSNGLSVPTTPVASRTTTINKYDRQNRVVETNVTETQSLIEFAGALDLTFVFSGSDFVSIPDGGEVITQRTITRYLYNTNAVRREVHRYSNWGLLQTGQQAVNEGRSAFSTSSEVSDYINSLLGEPAYVGTEVSISDAGPQAQRIPGPAALVEQTYSQDDGRREIVASLEYVLGSSSSERSVNFTLPYTGDDYYEPISTYWQPIPAALQSEFKARNYGRVQNRLRLGNSQGVSLQISVELMPTSPFDALYLQAGGLTGQYRANGMSWTFDQNGIVGQVDALFWLAIGQTGTPGAIWFPMPPAVSVLPTTPSVTVNGSPEPANSGSVPGGWNPAAPDLGALFGGLPTVTPPVFPSTLEVESGLEPFTETVFVDAVTRSVLDAEDFPFSLVLPTEAPILVTRSLFVAVQAFFGSGVLMTRSVFRGIESIKMTLISKTILPVVDSGILNVGRFITRSLFFAATGEGAGYDPLGLAPEAWWDASDTGTVTTSGTDVTGWSDKSGNGWDLSQSTSGRYPTYVSSAINGLHAIQWPSTDNPRSLNSASGSLTVKEVYVVLEFDGASFGNLEGIFASLNNSLSETIGGGSSGIGLQVDDLPAYYNGNNATDVSGDMFPEIETPSLWRFVVPMTGWPTTSGVTIGMDRALNTFNRGWNGYIAELLVFSTALSTGDRTDLETYLMDKWGI